MRRLLHLIGIHWLCGGPPAANQAFACAYGEDRHAQWIYDEFGTPTTFG